MRADLALPPSLWAGGIALTVLSQLGVASSVFGAGGRGEALGVFLGLFLLLAGTASVPRYGRRAGSPHAEGARPTVGGRPTDEASPEFMALGPVPVWVGGFRWVSTPARTAAWLGGGVVVLGATLALLGV